MSAATAWALFCGGLLSACHRVWGCAHFADLGTGQGLFLGSPAAAACPGDHTPRPETAVTGQPQGTGPQSPMAAGPCGPMRSLKSVCHL